jgi:hypothetical protein
MQMNLLISKERIPHLSVTLQYSVLPGDSFETPICFLELLLAVALDRRPASLNHLSSPCTLTNHRGRCMSHVISMHRPGDPNLSEVIPYLDVTIDSLMKNLLIMESIDDRYSKMTNASSSV